MSYAGRMPIMYYGNESRIVEVAGQGVKVIINSSGNWYYSIQDMLAVMGEDFSRKVYADLVEKGVRSNVLRYPQARFYYGDITAIEALVTIIGTERAREVWSTINPHR